MYRCILPAANHDVLMHESANIGRGFGELRLLSVNYAIDMIQCVPKRCTYMMSRMQDKTTHQGSADNSITFRMRIHLDNPPTPRTDFAEGHLAGLYEAHAARVRYGAEYLSLMYFDSGRHEN